MNAVNTITFDQKNRQFLVACEPHIALRIKRVFGKIDKTSHGVLSISDTTENARDLEWFLTRYPLRLENGAAEHLTRRSNEFKERESLIERLLSRAIEPQPFCVSLRDETGAVLDPDPARDYQKVGAEVWLNSKGLLLGDDVGLGKTLIAILGMTRPETRPALVVTLAGTMPRQWQSEIQKFAPQLRTHVVKKGTPYDLTQKIKSNGQLSFASPLPDVIIINYHKLPGWAATLARIVKSIIFDECQELRRRGDHKGKSAKYAAAEHIAHAAEYRLGLSATPIYNYGGEFWNVLNCLAPDSLGTPAEFTREWCTHDYDKPRIAEPKAFGSFLRSAGIMLRRTRAEVGRELPPLLKIPQYVDADTKALDNVSRSCAELARLILTQGEAFRGQKLQASEELSNKLRQATGIAKAPFVADFVKLLLESEKNIVLFGWHREVYRIWHELLGPFFPVMFTGSESVVQKQIALDHFKSGRSRVLMMSLRAGAGLDGLQGVCRTVVFGELDWSAGVLEQNAGRVHRDGQKESVAAYYLISNYGSDPIMVDVLGIKKAQLEGVRDPSRNLVEKLDVNAGDHIKRLAVDYLKQTGAAA
jgi:SNF2 family DNA or RNA helicase